jgi:hypothetical protein
MKTKKRRANMPWINESATGSGGGNNIILEVNKPRRVRILHDMEESPLKMFFHSVPADQDLGRKYQTVLCNGRYNNCSMCIANDAPNFVNAKNGEKPYPYKVTYMINVYDYDTTSVKIFMQGSSMFESLEGIATSRGSFMQYDVELLKSGQGRFNTNYSATPLNDSPFDMTGVNKFDLEAEMQKLIKTNAELDDIISGHRANPSTPLPPAPMQTSQPAPLETLIPPPIGDTFAPHKRAEPKQEELIKPIMPCVLTKGKYDGKTLKWIGENDPKYLKTVLTLKGVSTDIKLEAQGMIDDSVTNAELPPVTPTPIDPAIVSANGSMRDTLRTLIEDKYSDNYAVVIQHMQAINNGQVSTIDSLNEEQVLALHEKLTQ